MAKKNKDSELAEAIEYFKNENRKISAAERKKIRQKADVGFRIVEKNKK
jgi:hypothetical protein